MLELEFAPGVAPEVGQFTKSADVEHLDSGCAVQGLGFKV